MHIAATTLILLVVSTAVVVAQTPNTIQPLFSCWFTTYASGNTGVVSGTSNIVLGYSNSFAQSQVVAPTDTTTNIVLPADYNTDEFYTFQVGLVQNARVIVDSLGVLRAGGVIQWIVNNASVSVSQEHLTPQAQCGTLFPQSCPVAMTGFCSDGTYCNGAEVCFPSLLDATIGFCMAGNQAVQCSDPTWSCSEQALTCVAPAPTETPTQEPTGAPTNASVPDPTESPTEAPTTTEAPTNGPTAQPTDEPAAVDLACVVNSDCYSLDSFCDGAYRCSSVTQRCVRANASWDPCASARDTLEAVYNATHNDTSFPLSVVCVEPRGCVLMVLDDQDLQVTAPPPTDTLVIPPSSDEPVGDEHGGGPWPPHAPTAAPTVNPNVALGIGITAGILIFLGFIALLAALWYEMRDGNSYLNSTALAQASLQASALNAAARNMTGVSSGNFNSNSNGMAPNRGVYRPPHNAHTTR